MTHDNVILLLFRPGERVHVIILAARFLRCLLRFLLWGRIACVVLCVPGRNVANVVYTHIYLYTVQQQNVVVHMQASNTVRSPSERMK